MWGIRDAQRMQEGVYQRKIMNTETITRTSRVSGKVKLTLILCLFLLAGLVLHFVSQSSAAVYPTITTTAIDGAQAYKWYYYEMRADGGSQWGDDGGDNWRFVGTPDASLQGISIDTVSGIIRCYPTKVGSFNLTIVCDSGAGNTSNPKTFSLSVCGSLRVESGPVKLNDFTCTAGAVNVPMGQFRFWALGGEDIKITSLKFHGLGTGTDTFDVANVRLYIDVNRNGVIDTGAGDITYPEWVQTFTQTEGFNPTVTFSNVGYKIDSTTGTLFRDSGSVDFLVGYDFQPTVEQARTFRCVIEAPGDIVWSTLTTQKTVGDALSAGAPWTGNPTLGTIFGYNGVSPTDSGCPYRGPICTIEGLAPMLPTLYIANPGMASDSKYVPTNSETHTLPIKLWADSSHTMVVTSLTVTDSGTGIAASQVEAAKLYYDVDHNYAYTSGTDVLITTASFSSDKATFTGLNIPVTTPTGLATDPNCVYLLVNYKFIRDIPITTPPLTFQGLFTSATSITAYEQITGIAARILPDTPALFGNVLAITTVDTTGSTGNGPYITSAVYYDNGRTGVVKAGDTIIVTFDTNLQSGGSAVSNNILLPVTGDRLGAGASFSFPGGNQMMITLGTNPILTIPGTYSSGSHGTLSPSGINLYDTVTTIKSFYGLSAVPAFTAVDITAGYGATSSSSSSTSSDTRTGSKVCLVTRVTGGADFILRPLRAVRDWMLATRFGRLLARLYYYL